MIRSASLLTAILWSGAAFAQPSSPVLTTPQVAPPRVPDTATPAPEMVPLRSGAPEQAANIRLTPARIVVMGGLPDLAADESAITAPLEGHDITAAQLFDAASRIEALYVAHGYVLVRVVMPPQDLPRLGGQVRISVIDGIVGAAEVSGVPERVRAVVARHLQALISQPWLTRGQLERRLLLAGDAAGIPLRTTIAPGDTPGTVRLALTGEGRALDVEAAFDNAVGSALGGSVVTLSPVLRSVFGQGETIYGIVGVAPFDDFAGRRSPRRFAALGVTAPIGSNGLRVTAEGLVARTRPIVPAGVLATDTRYIRTAFRLAYPIVRSRAYDLTAEGSFELVDERQVARDFGLLLYRDRLRPVRLGLRYARRASGSTFELAGQFSQGLSALGARDVGNAPLAEPVSRASARANFTKLELTLNAAYAIGGKWSLAVHAQGQASLHGPLFGSEQMSVTGPHAVSGFDLGSLAGDNAALVRSELRYAMPLATTATLEPYGFAASSFARRLRPSAVETGTIHASALGAGARLTTSLGKTPLRIEAEVARGLSDVLPSNWRFNLGLAVGF